VCVPIGAGAKPGDKVTITVLRKLPSPPAPPPQADEPAMGGTPIRHPEPAVVADQQPVPPSTGSSNGPSPRIATVTANTGANILPGAANVEEDAGAGCAPHCPAPHCAAARASSHRSHRCLQLADPTDHAPSS
jgi:hypothetical protein